MRGFETAERMRQPLGQRPQPHKRKGCEAAFQACRDEARLDAGLPRRPRPLIGVGRRQHVIGGEPLAGQSGDKPPCERMARRAVGETLIETTQHRAIRALPEKADVERRHIVADHERVDAHEALAGKGRQKIL